MYRTQLTAGWGDMDFNSHMRNTAYLDKSADVRMMYFAEHGFPMKEFMRLKIGPVVMKDEIEYFREIHLLEEMTVELALGGLAEDGSRMMMQNRFFRHDGKAAAIVRSAAGWLDLSTRKLTPPPPALLKVLQEMPRTEEFVSLPSSLRA
jgi:acyl-CoA thioester hydrolase